MSAPIASNIVMQGSGTIGFEEVILFYMQKHVDSR